MDITLRILHIIFGVYVGGMYIFNTLILLPRLHALGSNIERPVLRSVLSVVSPVGAISVLILLGTGIAMAFRMRGSLEGIFATGWGWAILIGFIAVVIATVLGFALLMPMGLRMDKIYRNIGGREPNTDEALQLDEIIARLRTIERVNFVLIMIALVSMPVARFV